MTDIVDKILNDSWIEHMAKHSKECIEYNEKFFGDKANLGECICVEEKEND
jgi:hypothetical protein